ncbi:MAG: thiamine phosphate synthase [Acidobacteria bacterium]|nr:thiamine phosphate synthase [Acidobacteriota bacterium]
MPVLPRLMLVTDRRACATRELVEIVAGAAAGGLRLVQVRERDLPAEELLDLVGLIRAALGPGGTVLVNGDADSARRAGAGLHLAAREAPADAPPRPFGRSVHDAEEARRALAERPDYLVVGTIFATDSKPGRAGAGPGLVRAVARLAGTTPVFAIGGIDETRVATVLAAGAWGVAVRGAILCAARPAEAARSLARALESAAGARPAV